MRLFLLLFLVASSALADTSSLNLNIPSSPQSYQSDRFRSGELDCSNAIGSATNVEFGVVGVINNDNSFIQDNEVKDVGVYARINIPIGGPKQRINCNTLYQLELEKKRLEVQKLQAEVQRLQRLQFENDTEK